MRRWWLMTIAVLLVAAPAAAQQGSVQVIVASQVTTGDPSRTGGLPGYQPDFGLSWFRPTTNWGTLSLDAHAARSGNDPRLGRALFAVKDLKRHGLTWNFSAGDSAYTPFLTEYGFSNLFAPQVTFRGGSLSAAGANTSLSITAGRVTVFRDLFAANAETLGQSLFVARVSQKVTTWLEVVAHASRVRSQDLKEFNTLIESSDDAGAGIRVNVTKTVQIIGDAGLTSFRRKNATTWEQKPSMLVGTRWTGKQGWFQVDAHRFSPGNFSVFNNPYTDREGVFAGGEYTLPRHVSVFGGWDVFANHLDPANSNDGTTRGTAARMYVGARVPITSHLSFAARVEDGARTSKPSRSSVGYESDTGTKSAEWQVTFSKWNATGRYERRSNVDISGGLRAPTSTFTEHDLSGQLFYKVTHATQVFATVFLTERRDPIGGGQSFWQASAGAQVQLSRRNLFGRAEVTLSRNRELESDFLTPRSAFSGGLSIQIAKHVALSLDVYLDRSPGQMVTANPWMSRTMVRFVYTLPTGSPRAAAGAGSARTMPRGKETIEGTVFVDWNGNGVQEEGEESLGGIGVVLDADWRTTADPHGRFRFDHLVAGPHQITLDVPTVPADFDTPSSAALDLTVRRNDVPVVGLGLLPVGDIDGVVLLDTNDNGVRDEGAEGDRPIDGAVLMLDDGTRTEIAHKGTFRFSGVRMGPHTVQLLVESLPDGSILAGDSQVQVEVTREQRTAKTGFLVKLDKRPEIRKTFTPRKPDGGKTDATSGGGKTGAKTDKTGAKSGTSKSGETKSGNTKSNEAKSGETTSGETTSAALSTYGADKANFTDSK